MRARCDVVPDFFEMHGHDFGYADKDVQERIIRRSRLDWTIVRPTILTNGPRTGTYRVQTDPRNWISGFISRADVADFLVTQIDDARLLHKTPALTG